MAIDNPSQPPYANGREPEQAETETRNGSSRFDAELTAIGRILRIMDELAPAGQRRALLYLADRCNSDAIVRRILSKDSDGQPE